jgi:hypothetical protein
MRKMEGAKIENILENLHDGILSMIPFFCDEQSTE